MYVNLYPAQQLKRTKRVLLWSGVFLLCGGVLAVLHEVALEEPTHWGRVIAAGLVLGAGAVCAAIGLDRIPLRDAYFSMTPERIKYRLRLFGPEREIQWQSIDSIQASEHTVLIELKDGSQAVMRLGNIQCSRTANHVSVSLQLAAIEQNVEVNKVPANAQKIA
ncbi:hypothetical protein [Pontibacter roseus]|uniref:hypothetical protein n=1 Tax=Pontibacter roseus TaxID=336989 RepID=UPI00037C7EF7|nr:hypothetical protein [Pontibacter roseus]